MRRKNEGINIPVQNGRDDHSARSHGDHPGAADQDIEDLGGDKGGVEQVNHLKLLSLVRSGEQFDGQQLDVGFDDQVGTDLGIIDPGNQGGAVDAAGCLRDFSGIEKKETAQRVAMIREKRSSRRIAWIRIKMNPRRRQGGDAVGWRVKGDYLAAAVFMTGSCCQIPMDWAICLAMSVLS